ncbi:MAG: hypothetical protein Q9173_007323, partial [Seirophora scorigena]
RNPGKFPSIFAWLASQAPQRRRTAPTQSCSLCDLHSPLLEAPLVHLAGLLGYEMYTHAQGLRALHPCERSGVTNEVLAHLHPWFESGLFMPGTSVEGCLACALALLYNDSQAMRAVALLARSGRKRRQGSGRVVPQARLIEEGWLGYWAEVHGGAEKVRGDRKRAVKRAVGVSTRVWDPKWRKGVVFGDVVWEEKERSERSSTASSLSPLTVASPKMSAEKLMTPLRPDRPHGLTLGASVVGVRKNGATAGRSDSPKPTIPEKWRLREQVRSELPDSPLARASSSSAGSTTDIERAPRHATTTKKPVLNVSIPAPLNLKRRGSTTTTKPFADTKRARYTKASAASPTTKNNAFFSHEERKWDLPSPTSETDDEDDGEGVVAPSVIPGGDYSDSAYSDDADTEQRFLEEHDELMKMVGRQGLRTRDYLDTLPARMESRM